jgi:Protein of unknown function (DUF2917)
MSLTALLPRLASVGFLSREARPRHPVVQTLPQQRCSLDRSATLHLSNKRMQLRVIRGCVWITRDGCPEDIVLNAGDIFDQHPGAPVLVYALEPAELLLAGAGVNTQNE